jgi:hypothetical protein
MVALFGVTIANGFCSDALRRAPRIESIEMYLGGLNTGRIALHFVDSRLTAIGYVVDAPGEDLPLLKSKVTQRDINQLRRMMDDSAIRALSPRNEWFAEPPRPVCREGSADLVITWTDRRVILRIPPEDVRDRLPKQARRVYASLDRVSTYLWDLASSCRKREGSTLTLVTPDSREWKAFDQELTQVWKESLPRDRGTW